MEKIFLFELNGKKYYYNYKMFLGQVEKIPVSVRSLSKTNETYHPARITYTGITIGGVHTGSINVQEAHYTFKDQKSGKGKISIDGISDATELRLSKQLAEEAKKDSILKHWLSDGRVLKLREPRKQLSQAQLVGMLNGTDVSGRTQYLNDDVDKHYNMNYCVAVCDFVAKALDGAFLTDEQRKELEQAAINKLTNSNKPKDWNLIKNYLSQYTDDWAKEIIIKMDEKLSPVKKYEIDGLVFYDEDEYIQYKSDKWMEEYNKKEKRTVMIGMLIGIPVIIGLVYFLMAMMGIV